MNFIDGRELNRNSVRLRNDMTATLPRLFRMVTPVVVGAILALAAQAFALTYPWPRKANYPVVVGYFTNSSLYSKTPSYVKDLVRSGSAGRLDQINYSAASVSGGHCGLGDPTADIVTPFSAENSVNGIADDTTSQFRGYFHQLAELKRKYPHLKILISLEGRGTDFALGAQPDHRAEFVRSCVDLYLKGKLADGVNRPGLFDGIDIDWESPHQEDAANFQALIEEFRRQMNEVRLGLKLSIAVGPSPHMLSGTDFKAIAPFVDEVGVMNYDYAGPWSTTTGLIAPLFTDDRLREQEGSIAHSIASYQQAGVPARKLLMGIPFYGYGWSGISATNNGLFQTGRGVRGDHPYSYIRTLAVADKVFRDGSSQAPWIFDGQNFWTYEDPVSIHYKASFAARQGLGEVMIWELSGDTADGELMGSVYKSLHHPLPAETFTRSLEALQSDSGVKARPGEME